MKKHLDFEVTGLTALNRRQFSEHHETPLADLGLRPVLAGDEKDMRRFCAEEKVGKTMRIPHSRLRAGQMVVNTNRVQDMAENPPEGVAIGQGLPSGEVMLKDGHHRVAADIVRGRTSSRVHVDTAWVRRT